METMSRCRRGFLFALLLWFPSRTYPQNPSPVSQIEITSDSKEIGGMPRAPQPEPAHLELTIRREKDAYYADDKVIDAKLVADLVTALTAHANPDLNLDDLGVTPAWLKAHASSVAQHFASTLIDGVPTDVAILASAFADPSTTDKLIPTLFDTHHYSCSDCTRSISSVRVVVTFEDGSTLKARSGPRFPYLLPWLLSRTSTAETAYNAAISRAVAALLPENAANRSRLMGQNLDLELGQVVMRQVAQQAQMLDIENQTGGTLRAVRARYQILSARINSSAPPLSPSAQAQPKAQSLYLQLQPLDLPDAFFGEDVELQYLDGQVIGTDKFLENAPRFEKLVLSVPWLNQYMSEHAKEHLVRPVLSFSGGVSLSDTSSRAFAADMRAIGQDQLIPDVQAVQDQIALLTFGLGAERSEWLAFPDGHMLLWRFANIPAYGKSDLIKWQPADFTGFPCAKPLTKLLNCVGRQISPDGKFLFSH